MLEHYFFLFSDKNLLGTVLTVQILETNKVSALTELNNGAGREARYHKHKHTHITLTCICGGETSMLFIKPRQSKRTGFEGGCYLRRPQRSQKRRARVAVLFLIFQAVGSKVRPQEPRPSSPIGRKVPSPEKPRPPSRPEVGLRARARKAPRRKRAHSPPGMLLVLSRRGSGQRLACWEL